MNPPQVLTSFVNFDNLTLKEAASSIVKMAATSSYGYVVTPNIDHLARLCDESEGGELYNVYRGAALNVCDSRIVEKLLNWSNKSLKEVVVGSDLTRYLFEQAMPKQSRVLIFGNKAEEFEALKRLFPQFELLHIEPSMGFIKKMDEVEQLIQQVKKLQADFLFIAVGSPRQEQFAYYLKESGLNKGVALCVGASINFIVGAEKRSPVWMQKIRMEWLYRMCQDPSRLVKRYFSNALYLNKIYKGLKKDN